MGMMRQLFLGKPYLPAQFLGRIDYCIIVCSSVLLEPILRDLGPDRMDFGPDRMQTSTLD